MSRRICFLTVLLVMMILALGLQPSHVAASPPQVLRSAPIVVDHRHTDLSQIPDVWLAAARQFTVHYAHTSHGSQVLSGLEWLEGVDATKYNMATSYTDITLPSDTTALRFYDGNNYEGNNYITPDMYWEAADGRTHTQQVANSGLFDFSLWTWCGQASSYNDTQIQLYLNTLAQFETQYPSMGFIYYTGHTDGSDTTGTLWHNNNLIRQYVQNNNKVLFDFADIETYAPDGSGPYWNNGEGTCEWCASYCASHPGYCSSLPSSCAHSGSPAEAKLFCKLKGQAFWWLMARLAGWPGPEVTDANVDVTMGGGLQENRVIAAHTSTRASYAVNNGPVAIASTNGIPIIASQRVAYNDGTAWTDFSEVMGLPANQATTAYWFPWYNNVDLNTQLRFANLGSTATNIWITIGGVVQPPIPLAVGESTRVSYPISNGPVKVESSMGNIVASMRVAYNDGTAWTNFSEVMGLPANQATTAYWFPWYNNVDLNTQIRFANLGSTATNIWITIGGVVQPPIPLAAGQSTRVSYPINNGPVKVESSMGNIVASMRVAYNNGTAWTSFSEVMGLPANQATTAYWFPWYNNLDLNTQIRFANLGSTAANIWVTIGGVPQAPIPLAAGQSTRVSYPINNGPVKVESSGGNIVASMRVAYKDGTAWTSFSEVLGVPANQLTTDYWFPWYNNIELNTQVRFAVP